MSKPTVWCADTVYTLLMPTRCEYAKHCTMEIGHEREREKGQHLIVDMAEVRRQCSMPYAIRGYRVHSLDLLCMHDSQTTKRIYGIYAIQHKKCKNEQFYGQKWKFCLLLWAFNALNEAPNFRKLYPWADKELKISFLTRRNLDYNIEFEAEKKNEKMKEKKAPKKPKQIGNTPLR